MRRLVLIGGGHAHLYVLEALANMPFADTEVTLVTPYTRQIYSGMLPGWLTNTYALDECALPLDRLAKAAGVALVQSSCVGLDLSARQVVLADGEKLAFDTLSIDSGSTTAPLPTEVAGAVVLPIRPIEGFVAAWPGLLASMRQMTDGFNLAIIGDGAAGVELACAIRSRLEMEEISHVRLTLVGTNEEPLAAFPAALRHRADKLLKDRGVSYLARRRVVAVRGRQVGFDDGTGLPVDAVLLVTGATAPDWAGVAGLTVDAQGFIRVSPTLQSLSHPFVFAAGDVAAYADARPKSGVFAVRAGPLLAANLRAWCEGSALKSWRPQRRALYLISTGQNQALATWGGLTAWGGWVWRWKDRIDRRFMARFRQKP